MPDILGYGAKYGGCGPFDQHDHGARTLCHGTARGRIGKSHALLPAACGRSPPAAGGCGPGRGMQHGGGRRGWGRPWGWLQTPASIRKRPHL